MAVLCIVLATTNATPVTTPSASSESSLNAQAQWGAEGCGVDRLLELAAQVECSGACSLPGCTIKYDSFMTCMRRAQSRGYVRDDHAEFVAQGLRHGFDLGLDRSLLTGNRVFKNWASAIEGRKQVTAAINKRMDSGKSLLLGPWRAVEKALRARGILDYFVFPMGAVAKKDDPTVLRPTDDHTKTGLNAQPLSDFLRHSLNTYAEVAWLLKRDYFMYVSDVVDAFLLLPLSVGSPSFLARCLASKSLVLSARYFS